MKPPLDPNSPSGRPTVTCAGILVFLRFTTPILDVRMYPLGGVATPGPGLAILMVATLLEVIALSPNVSLRRWSVPAQP